MSTALVTGSSGHVGSNFIRELSKQGFTIRCIDFDGDYRAYEGFEVEVIKGDITDKESLEPIFKNVDIVFHTAALINLDRRYKKQISTSLTIIQKFRMILKGILLLQKSVFKKN